MSTAQHMPTEAGLWMWRRFDFSKYPLLSICRPLIPVLVTETPAAGRLCRELRMGGSAHCGLAPWSGQWEKVREAE